MTRILLPLILLTFVAFPGAALGDSVPTALPGLAAAHEGALLRELYAHAGDALWVDRGRASAQATELLAVLANAETFGLRPADYGVAALAVADADLPNGATQFDALLSRAVIRLVTHLHYGRIDPRSAGFEIEKPRTDLDVVAAVLGLASAPDVAAALAAVEPHFHHYGLLKTALAHYRTLATDPTLTQLPTFGTRPVHTGDAYAGMPALRRLLGALGDLPGTQTAAPDTTRMDAAVSAALERFQRRHGLPADGALGNATYQALTTPLAQRVRQIELTLERWRWLPTFDTPPIVVNIPEFRLFALRSTMDREADIMQMPVIVGQTYPRTRTPIFIADMRYVVFRPYWDVPRSILLREMLPRIQANAGFLTHNHLQIVRGQGDDAIVMSPTPLAIAALAAGQLRLRQLPGDDNALGLVKFMFPNVHNVYLHSTPAHQLFSRSRRAFSHGCIRVSDPTALAAFVLRNAAGSWDAQRIEAAMQGADASRVELLRPITVLVLYGTAKATEAGSVEFFDDIYGHDRKLAKLLDLAR